MAIPLTSAPSFPGKAWQQVLTRDTSADGQFVYAVKSTGIYCRPSCPSRKPTRKNVTFFPTPQAAVAAGFRACLRCQPDSVDAKPDPQAAAVAAVTKHLDANPDNAATLTDLSRVAGLSPFHLQRSFKRVLGVSPRQYAAARKLDRFRSEVQKSGPARITDAVYEAGFSSSSRLYENAQQKMGMTPSQLRKGGHGLQIHYAIADSPLGKLLVASTEKGICSIAFADTKEGLETQLRAQFPHATIKQADAVLISSVRAILSQLTVHPSSLNLPLDVRATAFQQRVWQALQQIPRGETRTYADVARELGQPTAVRAVARACASNPVAVVVPCHRVVGSYGSLTGYRWGVERKRELLDIEGANI
ncbi:MAG: bifunctional DNA-binding transcriptional regulator/O6-methylguanine-DNA methyltransferase Ada [Acidobacteriaceae bacterium]